jgi:DNA invertase Pin-like site-specific DNA recombinase
MLENKITADHLARDAYLYIRQSTLRQVVEHGESTQRQYALRDRAIAAGWPIERIQIIDCDLGRSGAQATGRDGFQHLVSEVALGKAGIVMGLEVSRLARNCADWHKLIELCALNATIILDEDGEYDPQSFNDRLLLGLKGTMSEAELHVLKARLRGGVLNKARRGELKMGPPVGLVYRPDGRLDLDPDAQVQAAVRLVFDTFEKTGSVTQTVRQFHDKGLLFPRRLRIGVNKGELEWAKPQHSRLLQVLHNPRYAGIFVYGRCRTGRRPNGSYFARTVPREQWAIVLPDQHPAYITQEQFEANQKRLAANAWSFGGQRRQGPAREGLALLQGRVLCGICGARMGVHYNQEHGHLVGFYVCQEVSSRQGGKVCQTVPGTVVDPAISDLLLELMTPVTLEMALTVRQGVEDQIAQTDALLRQQVERARYEAELARHRYMKVDPDNRLVADALEAEWNAKLRNLSAAQDAWDSHRRHADRRLDATSRAQILDLAQDFPRIWNDPALGLRERKRMLRLLIEDVTLIKAEAITVHVRLRGGATRTLTLARPLPIAQIRKTKPEVVGEVDRLLDLYCDREIADLLNDHGCRTWENKPFNLKKVAFIRQAYHLPSRYDRLRGRGLLTAREVAAQFGIGETAVHSWAEQGLLTKHRYDSLHRCLYEVPPGITIIKGHGGRGARSACLELAPDRDGIIA